MLARCLVAAIALAACVALVNQPAARGRDDGPAENRRKMFAAFDEMVRKNKGVKDAADTKAFWDPVGTPVGAVGNMAKVWLELCENRVGTRDYVAATGYTWKPGQQFKFHVQVGAPVTVYLYEVTTENGRPRKRQVLPRSGKVEDGNKIATAGETYTIPLTFALDAHDRTEYGEIGFLFEADLPAPVKDDVQVKGFFDVVKEKGPDIAKGVEVAPPEKTRSKNPDEVAVVLGMAKQIDGKPNRSGVLTLEFRK